MKNKILGLLVLVFVGLFLFRNNLAQLGVWGETGNSKPISLKADLKKAYAGNEEIKLEISNLDNSQLKTVVTDVWGSSVEAEVIEKSLDGETTLTINPPPQMRGGKYKVVVTDVNGKSIEQDFWWGVLAINPNKSVYLPGDRAEFSMAVLDEAGKMVCDAYLSLKITNSTQNVTEVLSTDNGKITVNPECQLHAFTLEPDYEAEMLLEKVGNYQLELSAVTARGTFVITDEIRVETAMDFEVERLSATRIYPPEDYPMQINLVANKNFSGTVYESVPGDFEIKKTETAGLVDYQEVVSEGGGKKIKWKIDLKKGEQISLAYTFKAPDISPQFYLLGPLEMITQTDLAYLESRQWQLAADEVTVAKIRQEINIIDGQVTAGGTDAAIINLDTTKYNGATYYFEVIARVTSGTLTLNLSTGNTNTVGIGISDTSFVRVRQQFTPETGSFNYRLNLVNGTSPVVKAARVIILQSANTITSTVTKIEIGNLEVGLSFATTSPLASPKYWKYDQNLWSGTMAVSVSVTYKAGVAVTANSLTYVTPGVNTFTAPDGISSVKVEAWGGGGAGGGSNTTTDGCGGGGGGAYANKLNQSVTGGVGYTAYVGLGGTSTTSQNGSNGLASYFRAVGVTVVSAAGGIGGSMQAGGLPGAGGAGGLASASVGDTKWNGGSGGRGLDNSKGEGGPGGSSAGIGGSGWSGPTTWSTLVAGTGPAGSGIGGSGGPVGLSGAAPYTGNGGGGGGSGDSNIGVGGFGADGKVVVSWTAIDNAVTIYLQQDDGSFGNWTNIATIVNNGTATVPTLVEATGVSLVSGRNYRIVSKTNGAAYSIYNAKIIITQTSPVAVTKLEPQYLILNTKSTTTGSALGYQTLWNSGEWQRVTNVYKHAQDAIGASANSKLRDITASADLDNSSITGANQQISTGISMPTTGNQIDTWLVAAGTEVDASRILVAVTVGNLSQVEQKYFRWRDDTVALNTDGGWLAAINTGYSGLGIGATARLRFEVASTGTTNVTAQYLLEYGVMGASCGGGETYAAVPVTATSQHFEMVTSEQYADGDSISSSLLTATGTFVNGRGVEDPSNQAASISIDEGKYSEVEYAIAAMTGATAGGSYCFRLTNAGSTTNLTYTVYASLTLATGGPTMEQIMRHGGWFNNGVRMPFTF